MIINIIIIILLFAIISFLLLRGTYVLNESERVVIYRYGKPIGEKGPGILFLNPFIDTVIRLKLGPIAINIPNQEILSQDQIPVQFHGKIQYRITSALKSVTEVKNSYHETQNIALQTIGEYLNKTPKGKINLKENSLNQNLKDQINPQTQTYGVEVESIELKEI